MNETLKEVRAAVIAKVPEIVELTYGCEIHFLTDDDEKQMILHVSQNHPSWFEAKTDATDGKYLDFSKSEWERIGRPIQLSDVLRAIKEAEYNYLVSPFGEFWKIVKGGNPAYEIEYCNVLWNLSLDLDNQAPEVWEFLKKILLAST